MKLSLVLSALASIVVLVTAYPMEGAIAKRSDVEKRELDGSYANGVEGRGGELGSAADWGGIGGGGSADYKREEMTST
ncbi:hypothetical protein C8R48DRAFT_838618 [Suillus tomentosus]|nr:hypothetical protein C8R48DRAFT_838618 [Suillus tomentosus]